LVTPLITTKMTSPQLQLTQTTRSWTLSWLQHLLMCCLLRSVNDIINSRCTVRQYTTRRVW